MNVNRKGTTPEMFWVVPVFITYVLILTSSPVHAYIGPGLGIGVIGALIGLIMSVFLAFVALFWYPIKRLLKKKPTQPDIKP